MNRKTLHGTVTSLLLSVFVSQSHAQSGGSDVYWHIDPTVKSCSMIIDPSLTQNQWHTFVKQVGAISSFKSLASATPLGKMNFRVGVEYGSTPIDQHDPAWINTFAHPDADCPLGDAVVYPTLRASMGVSDNMDIGGYWTVAPGANYGMLGGEFKYTFLLESEKLPAAAVRASATVLTGVPDFDLGIYSIDLLASKEIAMFTPYAGIRTSLAVGTETTSKVDLSTESVSLVQGYAGVVYSIWMVSLAAEYNVSSVNTVAFAIGVNL
jgi:hypothetical protein